MHKHLVLAAAAAVIAAAAPVHAKDRTGFRAISAKDFAKAEARLDAERRIFPNRPELLLNLAHVYRHTGRHTQARSLYAQVLAQDAVEMDLPSGRVATSHELANLGLALLGSNDIAAR